jgi:hypothetical protein
MRGEIVLADSPDASWKRWSRSCATAAIWAAKFAAAHDELTRWIAANPAEAQRLLTEELNTSQNV